MFPQTSNLSYQSHHTGIETRWSCCVMVQPSLPIAPHWNWNFDVEVLCTDGLGLPIAPHWNWNLVRIWSNLKQMNYQSHHTGIETEENARLLADHPLPIAPHWNWNERVPMPVLRAYGYQSHHTGIETQFDHLFSVGFWTTNRTTLELKLIPGNATNYSSISTNRTTLELKRRKWSDWGKVSDYQSHHTGIETWKYSPQFGHFCLPIAPHWNWNMAS